MKCHLKCDEDQPKCQKCVAFGVICNYSLPLVQDLQLASQNKPSRASPEGYFGQVAFNAKPQPAFLYPVVTVGAGHGSFELGAESISLLDRFHRRTVYTFGGTRNCEIYQEQVTSLAIEVGRRHAIFLEQLISPMIHADSAMQNPFLMHVILTLTASHDRFLSSPVDNTKRSIAEAYHWSRGVALLNQKLSDPIRPQDRDPLWAAAAMLGILSITDIEASTPWEAWPLRPLGPSDLVWMNLSHGKEAVWKATEPMRPDGIFYPMREDYLILMTKPPLCDMHVMPKEFVELCQFTKSSEPEQNPYFTAVSLLTRLWHVKCTQTTMTRYMQFLGFMDPAFKSLLHDKDPRALLILACWYGPMCQSLWWMARRARLECQAICLYLEVFHADEKDIQVMLAQPKGQCELST
ncbi:uncharacterized protein N7482_005742 [Penicillium canariense]|uniref:Zn(2)-C6 fungal-type domain-containing protein n=1 Tax=Penicillium canariense TaxID=189055 RepID=A0A9W9LNA8_9EURO|nr:uncharacterized protein N7482_005742 [Penicillium canariense]KAJ5166961.1 hypothetical protein N7482_005742 [Penicillium canariense]